MLHEAMADPSSLWPAISAVGAVASVLGSLAVFVGRHLLIRRLVCGFSTVSLPPGTGASGPGAESPQLLQITILNRSFRGVDSGDLGGTPLSFEVGARLREIIKGPGQSSNAVIAEGHKGEALEIKQLRVPAWESTVLNILVDGQPQYLQKITNDPPGMKVKVLNPKSTPKTPSIAPWGAITLAVVGVVLIGAWTGFQVGDNRGNPASPPSPSASPSPGPSGGSGSEQAAPPSAAELAAAADLNSGNPGTQATGITKLQNLLQTAPDQQPNVIGSLAKYIRRVSPAGDNDQPVTVNVQQALTVLARRNPAQDGGITIDLENVNLTQANLRGIDLSDAELGNADFSLANLDGADLSGASLISAFLGGATIDGAKFSGANLGGATFWDTSLCKGQTPVHRDEGYNCNQSG